MNISSDHEELLLTVKILKRDPLSMIGGIIITIFFATAIIVTLFGSSVAPYNPNKISIGTDLLPPSTKHLMGTDNLGRDIFSRVIVATPIDAEIASLIVGISMLIGILIGSVSGYSGGRVDEVLMRITDLFLAIPALVLAIAVSVSLGPGIDHVIEANLIIWWPAYARLARAGAQSVRRSQFVEAAEVAGLSRSKIIRKHVVPNIISSLITYATLDYGKVILYASVLSYLGLGAQPPQSEWGRMVFEGQQYLASAWWLSIMPGVVIFVVALGFNLLGDSINDLLDPRYRR